jgi:hypothetical protein
MPTCSIRLNRHVLDGKEAGVRAAAPGAGKDPTAAVVRSLVVPAPWSLMTLGTATERVD